MFATTICDLFAFGIQTRPRDNSTWTSKYLFKMRDFPIRKDNDNVVERNDEMWDEQQKHARQNVGETLKNTSREESKRRSIGMTDRIVDSGRVSVPALKWKQGRSLPFGTTNEIHSVSSKFFPSSFSSGSSKNQICTIHVLFISWLN